MIKKKYKYDISIAILNYNRAQFLDRAVRSCLDQYLSGKTKELIIVDDASNDESIDFLNSIKKKYNSFKLIVNKKNKGPGYCSNLAIKNSQGKYFIRVDSDDYLNRFAVDIMADILNYNEDFGYVYCDHFKTDNWGLKQKIVKLNSKKVLLNHGAGILFRTDLIKKVGNYNPSLREAEDYELISKLNKICNSFYLPLPLYRYYMHENNISKSGKRSEYIKIIKKNEKNI
jgi:glycosyltransferase involved in cell wall biosynthesis